MTGIHAVRERTPTGRPASGYIPALDGLRAIAVLLVLTFHLMMPVKFAGAYGVDMFFVLSGFLISTILLKEIRRTGGISFRRFYVRRLIRLYPALLVVAAVVIPFGLVIMTDIRYFLVESFLALTYTMPVGLIADPNISQVWTMTWTLGIEQFFYLIWPVAILLILRRWKPSVVLAAAVGVAGLSVLALLRVFEVLYADTPALLRGGALLLGAALALALFARPDFRVPPWVGWLGIALIAAAVVQGTLRLANSPTILLAVAGSVLLVANIVRGGQGPLVAGLSLRPLTYLGRISYELYLWHWPLLVLAAQVTGLDHVDVAWVVGPLSVVLAAVTHKLLSSSIDRWKLKPVAWPRNPSLG